MARCCSFNYGHCRKMRRKMHNFMCSHWIIQILRIYVPTDPGDIWGLPSIYPLTFLATFLSISPWIYPLSPYQSCAIKQTYSRIARSRSYCSVSYKPKSIGWATAKTKSMVKLPWWPRWTAILEGPYKVVYTMDCIMGAGEKPWSTDRKSLVDRPQVPGQSTASPWPWSTSGSVISPLSSGIPVISTIS